MGNQPYGNLMVTLWYPCRAMPVFLWGINPVFPGERLLRLGHLQSMLEEGRRKLSATVFFWVIGWHPKDRDEYPLVMSKQL